MTELLGFPSEIEQGGSRAAGGFLPRSEAVYKPDRPPRAPAVTRRRLSVDPSQSDGPLGSS
jgi:hypothetical protein